VSSWGIFLYNKEKFFGERYFWGKFFPFGRENFQTFVKKTPKKIFFKIFSKKILTEV
jgi:hypothetical protein